MRELNFDDFSKQLDQKTNKSFPLHGQIELTYRCNFRCRHCYVAPRDLSGNHAKELSFHQWKRILDQVHQLGGVYLVLTGGDPLLHKDFFAIYDYAIEKGFLVSVFTNGSTLTDEHIRHFARKRPFNVEITLNGITGQTYEKITGIKGSFARVMEGIKKVKESGLPLVLKTNGLKENKDEIFKIKQFIYDLLGKGKYKFDSFVFAGLDGSSEPERHRLTPEEILEIEASDPEMAAQRAEQSQNHRGLSRSREFLYQCNSWMRSYYINPYGLLQFCHLSHKYSTDLTREPFKKGFYEEIPKLLNEKYKTDSKCQSCKNKEHCYHCPARAYLETGDEEAPVEYFCELAKLRAGQIKRLRVNA